MLDSIFILDRNKKPVAALSKNGSNPFFDFSYKEYLSTGASTFDFSLRLTHELAQCVIEKNFVLFERNNKLKLFQITSCKDEENMDNVIRTVNSETIGLELANSYVRATTIEGNVKRFLTIILQDTNYKVGEISETLTNEVRTTIISEPTSVYQLIQDAISTYNNIEFEFDVECIDSINGKYELYVNCYADGERGSKKYRRFDYDFNAYGMSRSGDATDFCSGLIGVGQNGITFKDIEWRAGIDPIEKPLGQDFLLDPEAHEMFSNGEKYILGKYSSNATTPIDLLWETYYKLQEVKQVKYDYEVPVYLTEEEYEEVEIGDTDYIVNDKFDPPLQLKARINEFEITDGESKLRFANYKEVDSNIKDLDKDSLVTKLSEAEVLALQQYLASLDIQSAEIEKILKNLIDNIDDIVDIVNKNNNNNDENEGDITVSEDIEDYKIIYLSTIDKGLFLGDARIRQIKDNGCANIVVETEETEMVTSSKVAQQYKDATDYYSNFSLGTSRNNSTLSNLMSDSNQYKIGVMVRYWCGKFGLDERLVYALMMQESSGNPYAATKTSAGGYGLMQCERGVFYGVNQTIKFLDGTTRSFTPSDSTMNPAKGGNTTINGVTVNQNISNQIMFGCHELRQRAEDCHYNVFATIMGYNLGMGGVYWCVCQYIKDKYGYSIVSGRSLSKQSTQVKEAYYQILDTYKAPFASYRQKYKDTFGEGTVQNIEYVLRYYAPYEGSLPYFKDKNGNKIGYGAIVPSSSIEVNELSGTDVRNKIVAMAKQIVGDHVDRKMATYDQTYRTVNYNKPVKRSGTFYGITNPTCYDCSSFVSCCYLNAGLDSVYNKTCSGGTLVSSAVSKSGWSAWKCNESGLSKAKPGDIIMVAKSTVDASKIQSNPKYVSTSHTMIYLGDRKVAHASGWKYHPKAIRIDSIDDYYLDLGTTFFLRPWDLAEADKKVTISEATGADGEIIVGTNTVIKTSTISEVTLKGLANALPSDYYNDNELVGKISIDNVSDNISFPSTAPYVFLHFGHTCLDDPESYINLLRLLQNKYPKKPIFVAKEYHANTNYSGYAEFNKAVDTFNAKIENYCNKTKYVIFIDVMQGMVDSNYTIYEPYAMPDGVTFNSEHAADYYWYAKKAIMAKSRGFVLTDSTTTSVTLTALDKKIHEYTKAVSSFTLTLASKVNDDFYSRIIFKTGDSIKFAQPSNLYLSGDDCKNGAFTPRKNTKYTINIFMNMDTELTTKTYYGSVTANVTTTVSNMTGTVNTASGSLNVRSGPSTGYSIIGKLSKGTKVTIVATASNGWYKIKYGSGYGYVSNSYISNVTTNTSTTTEYTNYSDFAGRDKLVANARSFYDNKDKLVHNYWTPLDYTNPAEHRDKWTTNNKYHIDDFTFISYCLMGYSFETSHYGTQNLADRYKKADVAWAQSLQTSTANILKHFVKEGWILDDVDTDKYSNVEKGDILFYDIDDADNNGFMSCSHAAICIGPTNGVNYMIRVTMNGDIIKIAPITDIHAKYLLCVGRINLNK